MTKSYTIELLQEEKARLLDARDVLNSLGGNPEKINIQIKDIRNSIESLELNKEGGKLIVNENGVEFNGRFTITPVNVKTFVDMNKYKWDIADINNISEILNKMWDKVKDENFSGKPRNKEEALKYLKKLNKDVKSEHVITRLRYNDGKDYVQDLSYFVHPAYMSDELLEAFRNGQTLTDDLEKELQHFIIEKSV